MGKRPYHHHSFILSLWLEGGAYPNAPPVWRISLEDPRTAKRHGFQDLKELMRFLEAWTAVKSPNQRPMNQKKNRIYDPKGDMNMERRIINPWTWQDEFGYVQANEVTLVQRTLYCSGQAANDSQGAPLHPGDMRAQITLALDNLETLLRQAGFTLADIMRLNIYTTDVDLFLENYDAFIVRLAEAGCQHTGSLLGVSRLAFPEMMVEIEATAVS